MTRTIGLEAAKRFITLKTHRIYNLPIVIMMPHSGCNCRCVMCDIWLGNANSQRLQEADVRALLDDLKALGTKWVVMTGGEALMNPNLFQLCELLKEQGLKITILTTGLLLEKFAEPITATIDEVIVSLDGPAAVHDQIRRIPRAFQRLHDGVQAIKSRSPNLPVTGRCVVQRLNFRQWSGTVDAAHELGLDQISFLAADVSSEAFNRPDAWGEERLEDVWIPPGQLGEFQAVLEKLIVQHAADFTTDFIAESPDKLRRIYTYYAALQGKADFPPVNCNAPWVSAVIEADGLVRPCYFHRPMGNIREQSLMDLLNSPQEIAFRRGLDMASDPVCSRCVCTLNLHPTIRVT
jgi:Fe-coproporphyrin III synthase